MLPSDIVVKKDMYSLSYVLNYDQMFFQTGYKVLQSQEKNGFIKCTKIIHNGKDKLVYDISKFKSLDILISNLNSDIFISIIKNLFDVIIEVKNNGFMQYKNIEIDFEKIFIDSNNYKVYLIYLPINNTGSIDDYMMFEKQLKDNIINALTSYPNINTPQLHGMLQSIKNDLTSIEQIKERINGIPNAQNRQSNTSGLSSVYVETQSNFQPDSHVNLVNQIPAVTQEKKKKSGFFSKKEKKKEKKIAAEQNIVIQSQCEGGATEILDDAIYKDITLVGLNTPSAFMITVTKQEFFIGKKADSVNACIDFNNAISRVHCKIIKSNNEHFIVDLGSANGTYVNGYKLNVNQQMPIKSGDIVKLANSEFEVK